MKLELSKYKTLVFDCDGVILNSNQLKTAAFYQAALPYGEAAAQALVDYHTATGGISRYKKFSYFLEEITPKHSSEASNNKNLPNLDQLLTNYANYVEEGLLTCEVAEGLEKLREATPNANWLIVSGGDQQELREVFAKRGLDNLFNSGIFGSPDTKDQILSRELASGNITQPALFLGDSKYDHQAATTAGLDFVFLSGWTEVGGWKEWAKKQGIVVKASVAELALY